VGEFVGLGVGGVDRLFVGISVGTHEGEFVSCKVGNPVGFIEGLKLC
jgi:hypothetical protein